MSKSFECEVRCVVFARVWVQADSEKAAREKLQRGAGFWDSIEFENHTAECDDVQSVKEAE